MNSTKEYELAIEDGIYFDPTTKEIINDLLESEKSLQRQIYKRALEVLKMAIDTKDYTIDTSIINKILVEPVNLYDLAGLSTEKMKLTLAYEQDKVALKSEFGTQHIDLEVFKDILIECVSGDEGKRIEETETYKSILHNFLLHRINENKRNKKYNLVVGEKVKYDNGLGIIIEKNTKREIGTFERMTFLPSKNGNLDFMAFHMILDGITLDKISSEYSNYTFHFYSLNENVMYAIEPADLAHSYSHEMDSILHANKVKTLGVDSFDSSHLKYHLVQDAQSQKGIIKKIDLKDSLDEMKYEEFKSHRTSIIQAGKETAKKEKIYNQFADLDLDFG
jgi:hypothetical protein